MIPKIIHYVWLGGNEKPELMKKCIESWHKYCPDYEIKEWNESNFDINRVPYVRDAYNCKIWSFCSDYIRLYALYTEGGIYLDTDVELIKPIDDLLNTNFIGQEHNDSLNPGLIMGCEKGNETCKYMLEEFERRQLLSPWGTINPGEPFILKKMTSYFIEKGLKLENKIQKIDDFIIYPTEYFCPKNFNTGKINITENTYSIHHYTLTWLRDARRNGY